MRLTFTTKGPCLYGADDYRKCFPANFDRHGCFMGDDYDPDDYDDREEVDYEFYDDSDDDHSSVELQDPNK